MSDSNSKPDLYADGTWFRTLKIGVERLSEVGPAAIATYLILSMYADEQGTSFPSTSKIADLLGMTSRAARLAIVRLQEAGLISVERRPQQAHKNLTNLFQILPATPQKLAEPDFRPPQSDRNESSPTGGTTVPNPPEREFTHKETSKKETYSKKTNGRALRFDVDDMKFSKWMWSKIAELAPDQKKPNLETWASQIRLTRENDKRTTTDLKAVFEFAHADDFWKTNIYSPASLRKHFDRLNSQRLNGGNTHGNHKLTVGPGQQYDPEASKRDPTIGQW